MVAQTKWTTIQGKLLSVRDNHKKTVLTFWAPWCQSCKVEIPRLIEWHKEHQDTHELYFHLLELEKGQEAADYARKAKIDGRVIMGGDKILETITAGEYSIPTTLVLDVDSTVLSTAVGSAVNLEKL